MSSFVPNTDPANTKAPDQTREEFYAHQQQLEAMRQRERLHQQAVEPRAVWRILFALMAIIAAVLVWNYGDDMLTFVRSFRGNQQVIATAPDGSQFYGFSCKGDVKVTPVSYGRWAVEYTNEVGHKTYVNGLTNLQVLPTAREFWCQ